MNPVVYAATLSVAFVVGLLVLATLVVYLLDRASDRPANVRRNRPRLGPPDPYADASALAVHTDRAPRHAAPAVGRTPPVPSWPL